MQLHKNKSLDLALTNVYAALISRSIRSSEANIRFDRIVQTLQDASTLREAIEKIRAEAFQQSSSSRKPTEAPIEPFSGHRIDKKDGLLVKLRRWLKRFFSAG